MPPTEQPSIPDAEHSVGAETAAGMSFNTPDLCDQFDEIIQVLPPMLRNFGGRSRCFGPVLTVRCDRDNSRVAEAVQEAGAGRVLIVDAGGQQQSAMLGDRLASMAARNRWLGVVVHGCIRDVDAIRRVPMAVFALSPVPRRSQRRGAGQRNVELEIAGVRVRPGDWIFADADGVVIAPRNLLTEQVAR
jgi:regulator of ribonuclease activity A